MVKKITVKKKRRLKLSSVIWATFACSLFLTFTTTIFIRTLNQKISEDVQKVQTQINNVQVANESMKKEITALRNVDRVVAIASEAGLQETNAAVTIKGD